MKLKVNDSIPEAQIYILKDGEPKEQSIKETLGNSKILLFGLPGAYTSTCSKFHLPGYVKNVEKLNVWEAYKQAKENSKDHEPIVVMKKNNHKPLIVVDAEHFVKIYEDWTHDVQNKE